MNKNRERGKIDWMITLLPLTIIIALCILFFFAPEQSNAVLSQIRFFFGDTFGTYYLVIGLGIFILSLYIACSKYGDIVLGEPNEKPQYSFFAWGSMMFTCGLAADILFYSFSEWVLYATDPHLAEMGSIQDWAGVYPLFHWSFIPWGFYLVLAVAFGFMLHVRKRTRQKYSEACRPILVKHTDGWAGRIIDLLAVFALLAGTATTFSVATPLMATIIGELFHVAVSRTVINIIILLITACVMLEYHADRAKDNEELAVQHLEKLLDVLQHCHIETGLFCCGDNMEGHDPGYNCGHSPLDTFDYHGLPVLQNAQQFIKLHNDNHSEE